MPESNQILGPKDTFPPSELPTVFADGMINLARTGGVVRFYLMRTDPSMTESTNYQAQPVAQVIMPLVSFVQTAMFIEHQLNRLVEIGAIDQAMVDEFRRQQTEPEA